MVLDLNCARAATSPVAGGTFGLYEPIVNEICEKKKRIQHLHSQVCLVRIYFSNEVFKIISTEDLYFDNNNNNHNNTVDE